MADAVTAGFRVTGLVTPVPSPIRSVTEAAMASAAYVSPLWCWLSVNKSPSQPCASTRRAMRAMRPGAGKLIVQSSMGFLTYSDGVSQVEALVGGPRPAVRHDLVGGSGGPARY